ncbi:MAG: hypothetical protein OGM09_06060 [Fusobacterium varium]|uniref:hypothetical protein n=1 Tax=Fusobacterium varium TaxID=856 RepID=UPI00242F25EB|nr:hypothetical protein [Fusobacterium varium]UYI79777.1 MAG: hypothetical protein OGM09_06060 [Fusobacterium varium]
MLKRKLYKNLKEWKNKDKGNYLCEEFGKNEYKSYIIVDFGNISKKIIDIFENERTNLALFFMKLSTFSFKVKKDIKY